MRAAGLPLDSLRLGRAAGDAGRAARSLWWRLPAHGIVDGSGPPAWPAKPDATSDRRTIALVTLDDAMQENRAAVAELAQAAIACAPVWTVPRAPGKWSPSQVVEHVAMALEESARAVRGEPTRFPRFPRFLRAIARVAFFQQVLRRGRFGRGKTNKAMDPPSGPATPADARARLEGALRAYDAANREAARTRDTFESTIFGTVPLVDYARFQALHTRHHRRQLPA